MIKYELITSICNTYTELIFAFFEKSIFCFEKSVKSLRTQIMSKFSVDIFTIKFLNKTLAEYHLFESLQFHIVILKIQAYEYLHKIFQSSDCYTHYHIFRLIYYKVHYPYTHPDIWHTFHRRHMSHHCKLLIISVMYITRKRQMKG